MKHYKSNAQLKNLAKDKLTGKYGSAIWALLLVTLVTRAVTGTAVTLIPVGGWFWNVVSILLTTALSVFLGILQTGIAYYFLNIACNMISFINDHYFFTASGELIGAYGTE